MAKTNELSKQSSSSTKVNVTVKIDKDLLRKIRISPQNKEPPSVQSSPTPWSKSPLKVDARRGKEACYRPYE